MKLAVKSNFNKIKFLAFAAIAVGILGTTTMVFLKAQNNSSTRDITNQTVLVERKNWTMEIQANGVVQAVRKINLSPEDAGRVAVLYVKEGDRVSSGEIIARMSSDRLKAQVNQHRAILETARADLAEKLDGTRPEEIAAAKARVNTAKASVTAALAALARADEELQRNQAIAREGAISRNELGKYITARKQARAELEAARSRLIEH
ncbi:MAG: biotin/lipoyl-binding protein [Prochloraceae cyanobacterium]|nr:biotin/lipoyl-binding protein [Prochloraceae cyanobacterium]